MKRINKSLLLLLAAVAIIILVLVAPMAEPGRADAA